MTQRRQEFGNENTPFFPVKMGLLSLLVSALIRSTHFWCHGPGAASTGGLSNSLSPIRLNCQRRTDIDYEGQSPAVCLAQSIGLGKRISGNR